MRTHNTCFSQRAAKWVTEYELVWAGIDAMTPEIPTDTWATESDYTIHTALFNQDILVVENLTNLAPLAGKHVSLAALPVMHTGLDAAPARIVGRPGNHLLAAYTEIRDEWCRQVCAV